MERQLLYNTLRISHSPTTENSWTFKGEEKDSLVQRKGDGNKEEVESVKRDYNMHVS